MNVMCHSEITPCDGMNQSKANVMNVMCQSGAKQSRADFSLAMMIQLEQHWRGIMMMMHQLMYSEIIILDANIHLKVEIYRVCEAVVRGESRQKQQASALTRE
jgi:hypothetical protein